MGIIYVSVEYSNDYAGFARGYYLVIVASGSYAKTTLKQIKRYEPSAYVKSATIYGLYTLSGEEK